MTQPTESKASSLSASTVEIIATSLAAELEANHPELVDELNRHADIIIESEGKIRHARERIAWVIVNKSL